MDLLNAKKRSCEFAYLICQFLHCKGWHLNVQKKKSWSRNLQNLILGKCAIAFLVISFMCRFALFNLPISALQKLATECAKKVMLKFADLVHVHKNKWTFMLTKGLAHATWLLYARQSAI